MVQKRRVHNQLVDMNTGEVLVDRKFYINENDKYVLLYSFSQQVQLEAIENGRSDAIAMLNFLILESQTGVNMVKFSVPELVEKLKKTRQTVTKYVDYLKCKDLIRLANRYGATQEYLVNPEYSLSGTSKQQQQAFSNWEIAEFELQPDKKVKVSSQTTDKNNEGE